MAYGYDNNGNLTARVDARDITTNYVYDALDRNKSVTYSDGTPSIYRYYDAATNGKGRLWWDHTVGVAATVFEAYDAAGRPSMMRQNFWVNGAWSYNFRTSQTYDYAGHVLTQTIPSGHTESYTYDTAGRLSTFAGNIGDGVTRTYATGLRYSEFGGLQEEQFGTQTALYHKQHYNIRGQLYDMRLSTASWATDEWNWNRGAIVNYNSSADLTCQGQTCRYNSGPDNNGNLRQSQYWIPGNDQMTTYNWTEDRYSYDPLNRLEKVEEYHGVWNTGLSSLDFKQVNVFDRWGNRTIDQGLTSPSVPHPNYSADPNTNRLVAPMGYSYSYDNAGNQTNDNYTGQGSRTYDAENRLTQAQGLPNNQWQFYTYNADGQRIKRNVNGVETWQIYGIGGELLAEYQAGAAPFLPVMEYGYRAGQLLVTVSSGDVQRLQRFIKNLYYNALARDVTSTELQQKMDTLAQAGVQGEAQLITSAKSVARGLFESPEYVARGRTDSQYVTDLYNAYLQRGPDTSGLNFWVGNTQANGRGATLNAFEVCTEFATLASTVYGTASGGDNQRVEHFVQEFYYGALQREPTSSEMQQQTQRLNNAAALGQSQVVSEAQTMGVEIFVSTNYNSSHTTEQYVTDLYEAFLQRAPDGPGLSFWVNNTNANGRAATLTAFKTSGEYAALAGTLYREAFWLVPDHLGTPRMVVNKSGSLSDIKRHDYLPFGEELFAGTGGRTTAQGYSASDGVRQKFTAKERDNETGLDYFGARYYASSQGRFTSADPLYIEMGRLGDPQQLNLYAYTRNNPLKFIDPLGLDVEVTGTEQEAYRKRLQQDVSFQTQINSKTNKVEIVDANGNVLDKKQLKALGKTLKGGEKELFNAITDTKHHVSIETGRNDSGVFFGAFGGGGKQKLDFGDIDLLDSPKNAGGFSAQQAVGHETLEAYAASKGKGYNDAHAYANKFFGGLAPPTTPGTPIFDANGANLTGVRADWSVVGRPGVNARITTQFVTPIPASAINTMFQTGQTAPVHVVDVEKKP
jgi:RHS repeat-associated protein